MKATARRRGEDIIDFGMGNPDGATPKHIVDKMIEAAQKPPPIATRLPRPAPPAQGHLQLVQAPLRRLLDPETEAIVTIGSKEGIAHLCLAILDSRDTVPCPTPATPSTSTAPSSPARTSRASRRRHRRIPRQLEHSIPRMIPRPKMLILNFPANPTTQCVDLPSSSAWSLCKEYGIYLVHDLAYADLGLRRLPRASVLEVPGAKDIAVEFFTLSKSYNMPGWRVGFMVGNRKLVAALGASRATSTTAPSRPSRSRRSLALEGPQECVTEIAKIPQPPRCARRRPQQSRLAASPSQSHHVRLGADPRAVPGAPARRSEGSNRCSPRTPPPRPS
jgi:alanine-synthesizing transaminase